MNLPIYPDLKGASVFVTGGGSGIGAGLTEAFLRQIRALVDELIAAHGDWLPDWCRNRKAA